MFDDATAAFLDSGCALIIGTVGVDGQPHAGRGWGLDLVPDGDGSQGGDVAGRLVVDAGDAVTVENLAAGSKVAITATSVRTLHSLQMKGRALGIEAADGADHARAGRYCDAFFTDILETDLTDPLVIRRMTPTAYAVCTFSIDEVFDQTPGPHAGAPRQR